MGCASRDNSSFAAAFESLGNHGDSGVTTSGVVDGGTGVVSLGVVAGDTGDVSAGVVAEALVTFHLASLLGASVAACHLARDVSAAP